MKHILSKFIILSIFATASGQSLAQLRESSNLLGMEFVQVPPGKFVAARFQPPVPDDSSGRRSSYSSADRAMALKLAQTHASPGFEVTFDKGFYISRYEVTQSQWEAVMGKNPSTFKGGVSQQGTGNFPVESVSWSDVQKFIRKLNQLDTSHHYRLPTEFEWEYAARAGNDHDISWDSIRVQAQLGGKTTRPVGQMEPNAWHLYDMLGNVWEWVSDVYNEKPFADAQPPVSGDRHVIKGASFTGDVKNATYMTHAAGPANKWDVGFRLVADKRR